MAGALPARQAVVERLAGAGCVAAEEEAATFLAEAPDGATLESWLRRREQGEPPAWITGTVRFGDRPLRIARGVYVPRPQTEALARRAAVLLPDGGRAVDLCTGSGAVAAHLAQQVPTAVDLCTGSGAVAAHLAQQVPTATVIGVDVDPRAAANARGNGVVTLIADLAGPFGPTARFDVVTAVTPYVPTAAIGLLPADVRTHEPRLALDGGPDGLSLVRRVVAAAGTLLRPGGWLLTEVGGDQDQVLARAFLSAGFCRLDSWADEDGDLRGIAAQRA